MEDEKPVEFDSGAILVEQGKVDDHAYMIESGSVKIVVREGSNEHILAIAGVGEVVGEMALFEEAPRSASVIALEHTRARCVTRAGLTALMEKNSEACMPFFRAIMERLRTSNVMLLASQKTHDLIKTTRIRLSFEPLTEDALRVCQKTAVIELDVLPNEGTTQILIQGLQKHFKVGVETFLPDMQR